MTTKQQVEYILTMFQDSRNSDALLVLNLYRKFYYLPDPVSQEKLLEILAYSKPSEIVRYRQKLNQEGKYLATDPKVREERSKRIKVMRESLGYNNKQDTL
jgi:hypothetical protein